MKHFTFEQFAISNTASSRGINNSVPVNYKPHAEELVNTILDPLTDAWGSKIRMTSGFRCKRLNDAIGGAQNSAHSYAYAADLVPENGRTLDFKNFTIQWLLNNNIKFDQFIDEYKGNSSWVHIGVRNGSNKQRQQWLKFYDNKYTSIDPRVYKAGGGSNNAGGGEQAQAGATGLSDGMFQFICKYETGKKFGYAMTAKDLNGYDLGDAKGHKTYGYGLLFHTNGNYMDTVKGQWAQNELEQLYTQHAQKTVSTIKSWASKYHIQLNQNQIDAIASACYNFGIGFLEKSGKSYTSTVNLIKKNPNDPAIKDKWCHMSDGQGKKYPGLITRRKAEADWYFSSGAVASNVNYSSGGGGGYNSSYSGGGYSSGGSSSGGGDTRQYNNINVTQIRTGGSTQTGSTEGLLQGKSVYLKDRDIIGIQNNDVYVKDENGQPLFDENGDLLITDDYLFDANESVSDGIESIDELDKEPFDFDMSKATLDDVEQVQGLQFNADGSYIVRHSKTVQEIIAMAQKWWELVQSLQRIDFKNIQESIKKYDEEQEENMKAPSINAMVYMKAAFDMYGHAFREGMVCPVCGKKARYLPPGGYCSVECLLKAAKDKSLAFLMAPNQKYAWLQDIINQLCAVLDLTNLLINAVVLIPDIIRELAQLPPEYKEYVQNKIAEGFSILQELIQEAMVKKNELLERILKPMNFGIIAKPVAMAMQTVELIRSALTIAQEAFNMAYDIVKLILSNLSLPNVMPGLVIPAESFAWSLTPRSFICPMYPTPANSDMGKIFVNLPGGWGAPVQSLKPLLPSALQNINMQAIDSTIQGLFPPLTPLDYYLEPELFEIRFLFSDQSDLVFQIRQQLEDLLVGGPDYLPKFENLLPVKEFTFGKGSPNEQHIWLPNLGYVWFLLGLMDAWAPHSKALVGSILNPLL